MNGCRCFFECAQSRVLFVSFFFPLTFVDDFVGGKEKNRAGPVARRGYRIKILYTKNTELRYSHAKGLIYSAARKNNNAPRRWAHRSHTCYIYICSSLIYMHDNSIFPPHTNIIFPFFFFFAFCRLIFIFYVLAGW